MLDKDSLILLENCSVQNQNCLTRRVIEPAHLETILCEWLTANLDMKLDPVNELDRPSPLTLTHESSTSLGGAPKIDFFIASSLDRFHQ